MAAEQAGKALGVMMSKPTLDTVTLTGGLINQGTTTNTGAITNSGPVANTSTVTYTNVQSSAVTNTSTGSSDAVAVETTLTLTGAGGVGWGTKSSLISNVALGAYVNGLYGFLQLGASGKVTGLGSGVVGEVVMSAGCVDGTYAAFEAELGFPTGAVTGTSTAFFYLSTYGADRSVFDTSGVLFNLAGVTKGSGKFLQDTTSGPTIRPVQVIKVTTPDGTRYLPLYSTAAIAA